MIVYRVKLNSGDYLSASSYQSTKDPMLALYSSERLAYRRAELSGGTVEQVNNLKIFESCKVGDLAFGMGDTFSHVSLDGVILKRTKKYIWACPLNKDGEPNVSKTKKYKISEINTRDFQTGEGILITA